ncbi:hypothetical protein NA57DRAFT_57636 [Rhizodiscina lignyota]|uniref:Uncharacterized protein n=1 Tax=Rhizodiscina lignyota TaxID=1504668 RepID=A0A9P4I893_9PEZI|nr:hypothetical protein NA57DRAFT_57636 [Rhizodiscina lignyota]
MDATSPTQPPVKRQRKSEGSSSTNFFKATMNRFLTKKRAKKAPEVPKPELDLTAVLPPSDNFRTSLLMPSLSTRFSMLREQDDPSSKLGKASDDSVLTPNRRSRLYDFGYSPSGLTDIAEVASINGSVKPFVSGRRQDSFASADGYGSDNESMRSGSMMTRSRPGEGNVLFGGRQKIYKIAVGGQSEKSLGSSSTGSGMGGRAVYEDDVNLSAFQKYKQAEREKQLIEAAAHFDFGIQAEPEPEPEPEVELAQEQEQEQESLAKGPSTSPSFSNYNNRRETTSSTTSGQNTRTSTAATSVNSQGANAVAASPALTSPTVGPTTNLDRSGTKSKRLYDHGLDKDIQDQHSTTLNRLNSIQKGRGIGMPYISQPKSAPNLLDRYQRGNPLSRTVSPISPALSTIPSDVRDYASPEDSPRTLPDSRPISPLGSDFEDNTILSASIDPRDRGKATALGVFNKPTKFDQSEYLQRQKQMEPGRSTPTLTREPSKPTKPTGFAFSKPDSVNPELARSRSPTNSSQKSEHTAFSLFQNAANQMKMKSDARPDPRPLSPDAGKTFLTSPGASEIEFEPSIFAPSLTPYGQGTRVVKKADIPKARLMAEPPRNDHPAFRPNSPFERIDRPEEPQQTPNAPMPQRSNYDDILPSDDLHTMTAHEPKDVSPPPATGAGLSGLVRQHLRHGSDKSSIYDFPSQPPPLRMNNSNLPTYSYGQGAPLGVPLPSQTPEHTSLTASNPWDLDDFDGAHYQEPDSRSSVSPMDSDQLNDEGSTPKAEFDGLDTTPEAVDVPWQRELKAQHARGASTETTAEREALANELEARRRAIQEKLKNKAESEMRSSSPTPPKAGGLKAMNILKSKSSRDSMVDRTEPPQSKAKKMLGLGGSSTNLVGLTGPGRRSEEEKARHAAKYGVPIPPDPEDGTSVYDTRSREPSRERSKDIPRSAKGRSPPASSRSSGMRNRSDSEASGGRSRSRSGRYKDDLEKAMVEGTSSRTTSMYPDAYSTPDLLEQHPLPPPLPQLQSPQPSPRLRSNSKSNSPAIGTGQWDQSQLHPAMRTNVSAAPSPKLPQGMGIHALNTASSPNLSRPSPSPLQPSNTFPGLAGPSPNFQQSSFAANMTPPISGSSTPVYPTFPVQQTQTTGSLRTTTRKRSIQKSEISEPTLISTTSVVDTVNLPPGASLKNGLDEAAPPVPPINPRRRMFGFGRSGENSPNTQTPLSNSPPREAGAGSVFEEDDFERSRSRYRLRKTPSNGNSLAEKARRDREIEMLGGAGGPQVLHQPVGSPPIVMEGGMF